MKKGLIKETNRMKELSGLNNIIKENAESTDLTFNTKITDVDEYFFEEYYNIPKDIIIETSFNNTSVTWALDIDARNYGIKSIYPTFRKVEGNMYWVVEKEDLTPEEIEMFKRMGGEEHGNIIEGIININKLAEIFEVKFELEVEKGKLFPYHIEIDFRNKVIEIN